MGAIISRKKKHQTQNKIEQPQNIEFVSCPICSQNIQETKLNSHTLRCQQQFLFQQEAMISQIIQNHYAEHQRQSFILGIIDIKIPINKDQTEFIWKKVQIPNHYNSLSKRDPQFIKRQDFVAKYVWFKHQMQKRRSDDTTETRTFTIDKNSLIESSLIVVRETQPNTEIKIQFLHEPTHDAGGLLRQWIHMLMKQFFEGKEHIFEMCQTTQPLFRLVSFDLKKDKFKIVDKFRLFGLVLAKAIIENIHIQYQLCWPLLRQIFRCKTSYEMRDIHFYDEQLFRSLKFLQQTNLEDQNLQIYFTYDSEKGSQEIVPQGTTIQVKDSNKELYFISLMNFLFRKQQSVLVSVIRAEIFRLIPQITFSVLQIYEIQMILNGKASIDCQEWKTNTVYKEGLNINHVNVQWFWQIVSSFSQDQLGKLLRFASGSSRLSLQGFQKLECNRGKTNKFEICSTNFDINDPYPKGFTCFNRLLLPLYPSKQLQQFYLRKIIEMNLDGVFGLQ